MTVHLTTHACLKSPALRQGGADAPSWSYPHEPRRASSHGGSMVYSSRFGPARRREPVSCIVVPRPAPQGPSPTQQPRAPSREICLAAKGAHSQKCSSNLCQPKNITSAEKHKGQESTKQCSKAQSNITLKIIYMFFMHVLMHPFTNERHSAG